MARAKLKSFDDIGRISVRIHVNGLYYHIWYSDNQKIGFRAPYKSYLGTEVEVIKKTNRKGQIIPDIYTVHSRAGKPIFIAHKNWFEFIEYDKPETSSFGPSAYSEPVPAEPEPLPNFSELSWSDLFDM